jgi:hypothetical protein
MNGSAKFIRREKLERNALTVHRSRVGWVIVTVKAVCVREDFLGLCGRRVGGFRACKPEGRHDHAHG